MTDGEDFWRGQIDTLTATLADRLERIEKQVGKLREDVAGLKVVARVWGAAAGIVGGMIVSLIAWAVAGR